MPDGPLDPTGSVAPESLRYGGSVSSDATPTQEGTTGASFHAVEATATSSASSDISNQQRTGSTGSKSSKRTGSKIHHNYLHREEDVVGVIRSDLHDLLEIDLMSVMLFGAGNFFLSGSLWLLAEKLFEDPRPVPMILFCVVSAVFGLALFAVGWRLHKIKRNKVERIMEQSTEYTINT